jgi:DNA invertase Pin-like site-specific DNA recombinase
MTRITPEHLARNAFIYVRQSTNDQVLNNHESRRRQYGLADQARALGWVSVEVIDDDLGRSGSGIACPGFEKLLAAICEGRVGAVVSIEALRLTPQQARLAYAERCARIYIQRVKAIPGFCLRFRV